MGIGLDLLKEKIKEVVGYQPSEGQFLARRRHLQALENAKAYLLAGQKQLLRLARANYWQKFPSCPPTLGEITGEFSSDDLLGNIFSSFCIGK